MPGETKLSFMPPTFSWDSPNLYSNYKLFKQKVEITFKGQFKDGAKVGAILNWLGDNASEVYENLHWEDAAQKDNPTFCTQSLWGVLQARAEPIPLLVYPR